MSPTMTSNLNEFARVSTTAIVCGWQSPETRNFCDLVLEIRFDIAMASAAAVASSSKDALAISIPVKSVTISWKTSSASSLP